MRTALIIVDAWQEPHSYDCDAWPSLKNECRLFGGFINYIAELEHSKGIDIYHEPTGREILDNMNLGIATVVNSVKEIPKDYDRYLFCGFHYGRCIQIKANKMIREGIPIEKIGILINASMLFFADTYNQYKEHMTDIPHYLWSPTAIERTSIKIMENK